MARKKEQRICGDAGGKCCSFSTIAVVSPGLERFPLADTPASPLFLGAQTKRSKRWDYYIGLD